MNNNKGPTAKEYKEWADKNRARREKIMKDCLVFKAGVCKYVAHCGDCNVDCKFPALLQAKIAETYQDAKEVGYLAMVI